MTSSSDRWRRAGPPLLASVLGLSLLSLGASARAPACPPAMVLVGKTCVDQYEIHTVDRRTGEALSPFYPPEPSLFRFVYEFWSVEATRAGSEAARRVPLPLPAQVQFGEFEPKAVSSPGVLPQGSMTWATAKRACENAGKRLCSQEEWVAACRSAADTRHPYGKNFLPGRCNVFRAIHPAQVLHGNSSVGHLDPRLHLVVEDGKGPMLLPTGALAGCASEHPGGRLYDLEGNLDEWIDDPSGIFVGGFYSRGTREGCEARVSSHSPAYTDYSLGTRCCLDAH